MASYNDATGGKTTSSRSFMGTPAKLNKAASCLKLESYRATASYSRGSVGGGVFSIATRCQAFMVSDARYSSTAPVNGIALDCCLRCSRRVHDDRG